jgi:hypothetical protein
MHRLQFDRDVVRGYLVQSQESIARCSIRIEDSQPHDLKRTLSPNGIRTFDKLCSNHTESNPGRLLSGSS